jgi:uncharacterized Ntn-hydrolase superfamily protein
VVDALVDTFAATGGSLADRMAAALLAADRAGGDRRGRQAAALVVRQTGAGYGGNNDILVDLRVDDHTDPVPEMIRILGIHQLLFGKTPAESSCRWRAPGGRGVTPARGSRLDSLDAYAGVENLEERMWPDGSRIDPAVLEILAAEQLTKGSDDGERLLDALGDAARAQHTGHRDGQLAHALAVAFSGSASTSGTPSSAVTRSRSSSGTWPSRGTPSSSANS